MENSGRSILVKIYSLVEFFMLILLINDLLKAMGRFENNDEFLFRLNVYSDALFSRRYCFLF